MLAIPLATLTMVMSVSFLTILNVSYSVAWPVLIALTIDTLVILVYSTFTSSCPYGSRSFDAEGKISLRKLVKSKIFIVFGVPYIQAAIALPLIYYVLTKMSVAGPVQAAVYVISILIGVHTSTFIGLILVYASFNQDTCCLEKHRQVHLAASSYGSSYFSCFQLRQH